MTKFANFASEKNALRFKEIFQEAVADKVSAALAEAKASVAKRMFINPAETPGSATPLHKDSRGDISMHAGQVDHDGGMSNPTKTSKGK